MPSATTAHRGLLVILVALPPSEALIPTSLMPIGGFQERLSPSLTPARPDPGRVLGRRGECEYIAIKERSLQRCAFRFRLLSDGPKKKERYGSLFASILYRGMCDDGLSTTPLAGSNGRHCRPGSKGHPVPTQVGR
jgi:hypothetical protein